MVRLALDCGGGIKTQIVVNNIVMLLAIGWRKFSKGNVERPMSELTRRWEWMMEGNQEMIGVII